MKDETNISPLVQELTEAISEAAESGARKIALALALTYPEGRNLTSNELVYGAFRYAVALALGMNVHKPCELFSALYQDAKSTLEAAQTMQNLQKMRAS